MARKFSVRYNHWPINTVMVDDKLLKGADDITIVRKAMGHAFMEQLKGDWPEHADCRQVLDKVNPGVWVGRRQHPKSGQKDEPFYILEL